MHGPPEGFQTVDVQAIMRQIRTAVRLENRDSHDAARLARKTIPGHLAAVIVRLKASTASLQNSVSRIGEIPPGPPTARARLGAFFVGLMQRSLFWLIPSIRSTQQNIVLAMQDHIGATEEILKILQQTNLQLELLRRSLENRYTGKNAGATEVDT
jgi:hypothetical protein